MNKALSTFLCIAFCQAFFGQEYYFKNYRTENGLSHNTVNSIVQDERGFMWFGTKAGLNRFDGYSFKTFQNTADNPKSLGSNYIECLHEFKDQLWVGTDSGLYSFNEKLETFEVVPITSNSPILDIESDNEGNLWFIAGKTLFKYHVETKKSTNYGAKLLNATKLTKTPDGKIWIAHDNTLLYYAKENGSFISFEATLRPKNGLPIIITAIHSLNNAEILLGTKNNGPLLFNLSNKSFSKLMLDSDQSVYVRDFILKDNQELLIATEVGLFIYNLKNKKVSHLRKNNSDPYALADNALYALAIDEENGLWIGTYFGGINYFPKQRTPFDKYFPKLSENAISGNAVREIISDDYNNLWIGTEDAGLNRLDRKTGKFTVYDASGPDKVLSHYNIHALLPRGNELWVGTFEHGLDIIDIPTGKRIKHYGVGQKNSLNNDFVFALYENKAAELFAVTTNAIELYEENKDAFMVFDGFPEGYFYTSMIEDKNGGLWAGSYWDGLFYYDPKTKTKNVYKHDSDNPNSISSNAINGIFEDKKGNLWITTENGLNYYDFEKKEFQVFGREEGFPSNVFYAIIEGDENVLWISTSKGLVAFDPELGTVKIYTKDNGLLSDQFNYNSAYKDKDGTLFFGSVDGMISFNPKNFEKNDYSPPIYITGLQINNSRILANEINSPIEESVTYLKELTIKPTESSISLHFAALSYSAPELTEYWYKMEGLNKQWVSIKKNHQVNFTGLPPNEYSFKVKSQNAEGIWSKESSTLKIKVLPPFWRSNLAYVMYTLSILSFGFLLLRFYHLRTKSKNRLMINSLNNRKEKELYQAKIEFFTNVSHEILTPLTLIKNPLDKILKSNDLNEELKQNLFVMGKNTSRLLDLVKQLLDFRKTEMERIDLTFVKTDISELLQRTCIRFSQEIKEREIGMVKNISDSNVFAYVDQEAVKKIFSNLLNNAIKYAGRTIILSLKEEDTFFELGIKNDGSLIPSHLRQRIFEPFYRLPEDSEKPGSGIGLSLAYSLVELHKGSLELDMSDPKMNTFVLKIPIHQEKEFNFYPSNKWIVENGKKQFSEKQTITEHRPAVLLVEDNIDLLDFIAKDLMEDYLVLKTTNAEEALNVIKEESIQLIISDVMMPGISGIEFCEKLKLNLEYSHIPIILLTSKSALTSKIEGLEVGADAYIEKPFSMDYLKVQVHALLKNRKNIMEHFSSSPLAHIRSIAHTKTDETFINKLDKIIFDNLSDHDLSVETLAERLNMSRSTLYRKITDLSNLSPNELINITRLKKASELLKTNEYKIYEVSDMVGYNSYTSFQRNFQKQFNMSPTEYINSIIDKR